MNQPALDAGPSREADVEAMNLDALYRKHSQHIKAFISRFVRDAADAEDIAQLTFLEAARCADRFEGHSKESTWLFGIAHNLARNHVRLSCKRPEHVDVVDWAEVLADERADPARHAEEREFLDKALARVGKMSLELQSTFAAVLDQEMSYDDAAQGLGIPIGTVRSRLARIRTLLRDMAPPAPRAAC